MEPDWWARGIALAGVVLGAGALLWQTKDRARLRVQAATAIVGLDGDSMTVIEIVAVNSGRRPTTVTNLMLVVGRPPKGRFIPPPALRLLPKKLRQWAYPNTHVLITSEDPVGADSRLGEPVGVGERAVKFYRWDWVAEQADEYGFDEVYGFADGTTAKGYSDPVRVSKQTP